MQCFIESQASFISANINLPIQIFSYVLNFNFKYEKSRNTDIYLSCQRYTNSVKRANLPGRFLEMISGMSVLATIHKRAFFISFSFLFKQ